MNLFCSTISTLWMCPSKSNLILSTNNSITRPLKLATLTIKKILMRPKRLQFVASLKVSFLVPFKTKLSATLSKRSKSTTIQRLAENTAPSVGLDFLNFHLSAPLWPSHYSRKISHQRRILKNIKKSFRQSLIKFEKLWMTWTREKKMTGFLLNTSLKR